MSQGAYQILLIEDNQADVRLLRLALDQLTTNYFLRVLRDGEEALNFIAEQRAGAEPEPCVIVLDLHLPRHNGAEVLKAIRQDPMLKHIQVAIVTTVASPEEELEVLRHGQGLCLYRKKPSDIDGFVRLAEEILNICRHGTAAAANAQ